MDLMLGSISFRLGYRLVEEWELRRGGRVIVGRRGVGLLIIKWGFNICEYLLIFWRELAALSLYIFRMSCSCVYLHIFSHVTTT
jgi:hypothetical protein